MVSIHLLSVIERRSVLIYAVDYIVDPRFRALITQQWYRATGGQHLQGRNIALLDFPRDENFWKFAPLRGYIDKLLGMIGKCEQPPLDLLRYRGSALEHKARLVASFTGIRELRIDTNQDEQAFFNYISWALHTFDPLPRALLEPGLTDPVLHEHFRRLEILEMRSTLVLYGTRSQTPRILRKVGTIVMHGKWPAFRSLHTLRLHRVNIPKDSLLFNTCIPSSIYMSGWEIAPLHQRLCERFDSKRAEFQNTIETFTWDNMDPCETSLADTMEFLSTQRGSLANLSLRVTRERRSCDQPRWEEYFDEDVGLLQFGSFNQLKDLDLDARFFVRTLAPCWYADTRGENFFKWLNIPNSLRTLSLDAVMPSDCQCIREYLEVLLRALRAGYLPDLQSVTFKFLGGHEADKIVPPDLPLVFLMEGAGVVLRGEFNEF